MIPKIIHYCWFGSNPKPELVERCMESWHRCMPDSTFLPKPLSSTEKGDVEGWTYMEWNEASMTECLVLSDKCLGKTWLDYMPLYVRQAYEAKKYAFVSDYVRLWALEQYGGVYMDVDFEVYKSFEDLLDCPEGAFVGREGSKHQPPMLGVMASEPHGLWVTTMLHMYDNRRFLLNENEDENKAYDLTTNVSYFAAAGVHNPEWVHIYPVEYCCPILTTGEDVRCDHTYCEHKGLHSWSGSGGWKVKLLRILGPKWKVRIIKLKRKILG